MTITRNAGGELIALTVELSGAALAALEAKDWRKFGRLASTEYKESPVATLPASPATTPELYL
jgi:hypothetical protein